MGKNLGYMEENTTTTTDTPEEKKKNPIVIGIVILIAVVLVGLLISNLRKGGTTGGSAISGTVNFNGLKPREEGDKVGSMYLMQKEVDQSEYVKTDTDVLMEDNAPWSWSGAEEGKTYNLKMDLYVGDAFIKSSNVITVTAPASDQVLTMSVSLKDFPSYVITEAETSISGTIGLNGPVPEGSTVVVYQKLEDEKEFEVALTDIPAVDGGKWSWDKALTGFQYDIYSELMYQDNALSESKPISVVAPASGEVLKIDTNYSPEAGEKTVIAGTVRLVGPVTQDSTILLLARTPEEEEYEAVERYPAKNNTEFIWDEAISGQEYYVTAALQVDGENTSSGNVLFVTAPSKDELITIDTNLSLDAPKNAPTVACGDPDSTGNYNAVLSYESIKNTEGYYLQVGTDKGGSDVKGEVQKAKEGIAAELNLYVEASKDYFSNYAYTYCTDCDLYHNQHWSSFSPVLGFSCPLAE